MELIPQAKALLESGAVQVVLGHGAGTQRARRPLFARQSEEAEGLLADGDGGPNLATYLTRPEVKSLGRAALTAKPTTLRALLQLIAERQVKEADVLALAVDAQGQAIPLATAQAMAEHLAGVPAGLPEADHELLERLSAMSRPERWAFWQGELARCMKCYACRNSCPLCYCERCAMDGNRPQWVPPASHALGNLEYHLTRTMHLAGRCVACGACGRACPVGIPVHLLTGLTEERVHDQFGQRAGLSGQLDYALSTFRPDDSAPFIR